MMTTNTENKVEDTTSKDVESMKMAVKESAEAETTVPVSDDDEEFDLFDVSNNCMDVVPLLFEKGKRFFGLGEFDKALEYLGQAAKICEQLVGADSEEWAPLYFLYGHALAMNHFRWGGDLLEAEAVSRKTKENKALSGEAAAEQMQESGRMVFKGDEAEDLEESEEDVEDAEDEDGSVVDDLEFAWDWIEIARSTYQKLADAGSIEAKKMLGDIHSVLGDIQLENEQIVEALSDFETALEIKKSVYSDDSRILSEAYYKCACAFEFDNRLDEAIEHVQMALKVIKNRLQNFEQKKKVAGGNSEKGKAAVTLEYSEICKEIESLTGDLIPSLEAKIRDLKALFSEEKAIAGSSSAAGADEESGDKNSDKNDDTDSIAQDISKFIKKKHPEAIKSAIEAAEHSAAVVEQTDEGAKTLSEAVAESPSGKRKIEDSLELNTGKKAKN